MSESIALVYCLSRGSPRGEQCSVLVSIDGDGLCDDCRQRSNNCIVCGTGCHWWMNEARCLFGHASRRQDYATETDLYRERLRYYRANPCLWRCAETIGTIEARLKELAVESTPQSVLDGTGDLRMSEWWSEWRWRTPRAMVLAPWHLLRRLVGCEHRTMWRQVGYHNDGCYWWQCDACGTQRREDAEPLDNTAPPP